MACTNGGCGIGISETFTTSFGFSVTGGVDGGWAAAGFSVSKSRSVTTAWNCNGDDGDVVCMWNGMPYIEYDVRMRRTSTGPCLGDIDEWDGDTWRLSSPLSHSEYKYCVRNFCRAKVEDYYWEDLDKYSDCTHGETPIAVDWGF